MEFIIKNILLNISILVFVAYLFIRIPILKDFIFENSDRLISKIILAIVFGLMGILATYTGVEIQGAIANTRVIAVVAAGIIGGPISGIGAGIIAGSHRYIIDIGGFTALACGIATLIEGIIAGLFSRTIQKSKHKGSMIIGVTIAVELIQMSIILGLAKPFDQALELVKVIFIPMVLLNALGVLIFINVLNFVVIEKDFEDANRIKLSLKIIDKCLPYLKNGLYDEISVRKVTEVILTMAEVSGVVITDQKNILSCIGILNKEELIQCIPFPNLIEEVYTTGEVKIIDKNELGMHHLKKSKMFTVICAPLTKCKKNVGCISLIVSKSKKAIQAETVFLKGLVKLFSTELELTELDNQIKLRQKAEYQALQSQINPHFLFNTLNTISTLCREDAEKARELLIVLSHYFRNTLQESADEISLYKEIEHVKDYLYLEKARFEERLQIELQIPIGINCTVPNFILQPIVENAIKHGIMSKGEGGLVKISIEEKNDGVAIEISDNGKGMEPDILRKLYTDQMASSQVGLSNVHKRLKSVYGEDNGLKIKSIEGQGTVCTIYIPKNKER